MEQFLGNAANFGLGVAVLIGAVWWLDKQREAERKIAREERDKRMTALETRVGELCSEVKECRSDRAVLHTQMHQSQSDTVNLLRSIIDQHRIVMEQIKK